MAVVALGEAAIFNPQVKLAKGVIAPYVAMETLQPFTRDVYKTENKEYRGGTKFLDGDILMARITPSLENGKTSIYRGGEDSSKAAFGSTEFIVIRGAKGKSLTDFLYYLLTSTEIRDVAIASMTGSSGRQRVQNDVLKNYRVKLPTLKEQQAIAATLGALDDKIESNQRVIGMIDALVLAKFSEFSSRAHGKVGRVDSFFDVTIGRTPPRKETEWFTKPGPGSLRWASIKDMGAATTFLMETSESLTSKAILSHRVPVADPGDVLVSFKLTVGRVAMCGESLCTNEAIATVHIEDPSLREYAYAFLKSFNYGSLGSTSSIATATNSKMIKAIEFFCPEEACLDEFHNQMRPLFAVSKQREYETRSLRKLRDALLPELMSGRIRVPEARQAVEDATDVELSEVSGV